MRKLELKDICSYLPYDLKCQGMGKWEEGEDYVDESTAKIFMMSGIYTDSNEERYIEVMYGNDKDEIYFPDDFFPILRPMSDLTKEITHNGETFVPLVQIAKMFGIFNGSIDEEYSNLVSYNQCTGEDYDKGFFGYGDGWFRDFSLSLDGLLYSDWSFDFKLDVFDRLSEWHFDYRGLIPDGLAIDINTIKQ